MASSSKDYETEVAKLKEELRRLQSQSDVQHKLDHESFQASGTRRFKTQKTLRDKLKISAKLAHECKERMHDTVDIFVTGLTKDTKFHQDYLPCIAWNESGACDRGYIHKSARSEQLLMHMCIICLKVFKG